ncbi:MAG: 2-C-methyl-D-erythritol 2,4-cyclodiphosphate synthase [Candidatus Atribacteria bacterium]|nr:2-C-methyl-D-erythritol 2,4-cyclodiphosphate synthase [Candidatus Atribacteria bacterium]
MTGLRVGLGYDIHPFIEGKKLVLGGVTIPGHLGLSGHSDGDVVCHALMDSLLGAASLPDIGNWFPNQDERFLGVYSLLLLEQIIDRIRGDGWEIINFDCIVIAEFPLINPYVMEMKQNLSRVTGVEVQSIGLKATTNEKLGSLGKGEGIACLSVCLIWKN